MNVKIALPKIELSKIELPKNVVLCQNVVHTMLMPLASDCEVFLNNNILTLEQFDNIMTHYRVDKEAIISVSLLYFLRAGNFSLLTNIISKYPRTLNICIPAGLLLQRLLAAVELTNKNKLDGCRFFIKYGAKVNTIQSQYNPDQPNYKVYSMTPLHIAVRKRYADIVRLLLRHGAVIYPPLDDGYDKAYFQYERLQYKRERLFLAACFKSSNKTSKIFWLPKDIKCLIYKYMILR